MEFNGCLFPSNPHTLTINSSTNYKVNSVFAENSEVQNVSVNPTIVKGKGSFYTSDGEQCCRFLVHMLRKKESGKLILPSQYGMTAYLTDFTYSRDSKHNSIDYSFVFVEDINQKLEARCFYTTLALEGENAFDIANRCGVSVNLIMQKNDYMTPFCVKAGDRVVIA